MIDKLDKQPAEAVAAAAGRRGRRHAPSRRSGASSSAHDPGARHLVRRAGAGPRRRATTCSRRGSPSWPPSSRAAPSAVTEHVSVEANLRIARGLDYYTGTVVEIFMAGYERLKSVGGGGRYDALASDGRTTTRASACRFGVSRTLVPLFADGVLAASRPGAERRAGRAGRRGVARRAATRSPTALRGRGVPCEVAACAQKFGKQIRYAERAASRSSGSQADGTTRSRTSGPASRCRDPPGPRPRDLRPQVPKEQHRDPHPRRRAPCAPSTSARP